MPGPISKLMGAMGQGGSIAQAVGAAGPMLNQQAGGAIGGAVGGKAGAFSSMGKSPPKSGMGQAGGMGSIRPIDTHKAAYMAVLTAALEKAHKSPLFNIETAINDLNVKLGNLRGSKAQLDSLSETIGQSSLLSNELQNVMEKMGTMINQAASHLK